ncbi:MAG: hypothetical protein H0X46_07240 [Bacteroidetes bacterium]|nr:hypothetical protein [Bacteroidota bacterium]
MKLEFLKDINEYGDHVVRLYNFDSAEALKFQIAIQETIVGKGQSLDLTTLDFIEHINCKLILHISDTDEGILSMDQKTFFCDITMEGYVNMIRLIEPYCTKETKSFTMLYDLDTEVDFVFSPYGS